MGFITVNTSEIAVFMRQDDDIEITALAFLPENVGNIGLLIDISREKESILT